MATPTTLNIGEPADERSVDGNNVPVGDISPQENQSGDHEYSFGDPERLGLPEIFDEVLNLSPDKPGMLDVDSQSHHSRSPHNGSVAEYDEEVDEDSVLYNAEKKKSFTLNIFSDFLITPNDVCFKISPAVGAVSYGYFSLSVMDPKWFSRAFGEIDRIVGNSLWFLAHMGAGLYIYSRRHIRSLPLKQGICYSIFGSVLFNFGSCMVWGFGRSFLKSSPTARVAFGIASSCMLLYAGQDYLQA
ncbi:hypothetical protein BsWGS_05787 [Bradybaena similaris]